VEPGERAAVVGRLTTQSSASTPFFLKLATAAYRFTAAHRRVDVRVPLPSSLGGVIRFGLEKVWPRSTDFEKKIWTVLPLKIAHIT
jgi:hypothetical protein